MSHLFKVRALAAAAAGISVAMLAATPAHATVYSLAQIDYSGLGITFGNASATTVTSFNYGVTASATLNGSSSISQPACGGTGSFGAGLSTTCSGVNPVLASGAVNAPGSTSLRTGTLNFTALGSDATNNFSNANAAIITDAIVQGNPTSTSQIAESLLNTLPSAQANTDINSTTALNITFNSTGTNSVTLGFNAKPNQNIQISGATISNANVLSSITAVFTLSDANGHTLANWSPFTGNTSGADCTLTALGTTDGITCAVGAEGTSLNNTLQSPANPTNEPAGGALGAYAVTFAGLSTTTYSVGLDSTSVTNIRQTIPEPGSLALVGLALAGAGFAARRKQKSA